MNTHEGWPPCNEPTCFCRKLSAAPQPPEQPALSICKSEVKRVATLMGWTPPIGEPALQGGLTDERIVQLMQPHFPRTRLTAAWVAAGRAIEHELLATRKRSEEEVARIMLVADNIWDKLGQADYVGARAARAALERLIRGDSA